MTDASPRLVLPLLAAGQAQKELVHNEALAIVDALILPVFAPPQNDPPTTAGLGEGWIVGTAPTGSWVGHADALATFGGGGWRFVAPRAGMQVVLADGRPARWDGGAWTLGVVATDRVVIGGVQVVGVRAAALAAPHGGATVDDEARDVISTVLTVLRDHGLIAT